MTVWKSRLGLATGEVVPVMREIRTRLEADVDRWLRFREEHYRDPNIGHYASPFDIRWGEWEPGMRKPGSGHWFW